MSSGAKRNPDKLNIVSVVAVAIAGAALVYVSIVLLHAFYINDTAEVQLKANYGGQDTPLKVLRASQQDNLKLNGSFGGVQRVPLERAMQLVVEGAKVDPVNLVPAVGPSDVATILPEFGRPKLIPPSAPAPAPADPAAPASPAAGSAPPVVAPAVAPAVSPAVAPAVAPNPQ
jgi:hypothetical protein